MDQNQQDSVSPSSEEPAQPAMPVYKESTSQKILTEGSRALSVMAMVMAVVSMVKSIIQKK